MEQNTAQILSLSIELLSLIASVSVAVILYLATKKIETQNFSNSLKSSWISIDSTVLTNDDLLTEVDYLLHPSSKNESIEQKRRRWLCYMIANTLSVNHNGIIHKLLPDIERSKESLVNSLEGLTQHPEFMELVKYFYEKDFRDLCYEVHKKVKANSTPNPSA